MAKTTKKPTKTATTRKTVKRKKVPQTLTSTLVSTPVEFKVSGSGKILLFQVDPTNPDNNASVWGKISKMGLFTDQIEELGIDASDLRKFVQSGGSFRLSLEVVSDTAVIEDLLV